MPNPNSQNPSKGKEFQRLSSQVLEKYFKTKFNIEQPIKIGTPGKEHKFDLVSADEQYVGECKNYSWTEGDNVPSAKMGFINEAVFYLSFLPENKTRFIVMRRDYNQNKNQTLAEYYHRTYKHLIGNVQVLEIDVESETVKLIK